MTALPTNSFKQALIDKRAQIGLWLALGDATSAEICATAGFDWLLIDAEHAPHDLRSILAQLRAIAAYPVASVVRLPVADATLVKQVLEIGATALLIPMIETADQALTMAQAARYPPIGKRGVGCGLARSSRWSLHADYLHEADEQICLLVQVESPRALENLDAIVATPGVDGVFIGPADLAAGMSHLGNPGHPEVRVAIEGAIQRIAAAGKSVGILALDPTLARRYLDLGALFVAVGVDTTLLAHGARVLAVEVRSAGRA